MTPGFRSPAWPEPPEPRDRLTGFRSAGLAPGPNSDGRPAEGPPEDLPCEGSAVLFWTSESDGRSAFGLAVSLDLGDEWSRSSSLRRTSESKGRSAGDLWESDARALTLVDPRPDSGFIRAPDRDEAEDSTGSWFALRTSERGDRWPDRLNGSGVEAAVLDGVFFAAGFARSLDGGAARTLPSSLLRTSEREGRPADGPLPPRLAVPKLADGVPTSDRTLDRSSFGREALDRVTLGRLRVGEVWLDPEAVEGLGLGTSVVRRFASGELRLRPETLGAADDRVVRLGAW